MDQICSFRIVGALKKMWFLSFKIEERSLFNALTSQCLDSPKANCPIYLRVDFKSNKTDNDESKY